MIAFCQSCRRVVHSDKIRNVRCPEGDCKQWNSLQRITKQEAKALPKGARAKEARA